MRNARINKFWAASLTLILVVVIVKWIIPLASRLWTGLPFPLTVPGTLQLIYVGLAVTGLLMYLTFSEENLQEFWQPIAKLLRGESGTGLRLVILILVPALTGLIIFDLNRPRSESPIALRIQHPSSNFPKSYELLQNHYANPADSEVELFLQQARTGQLSFIDQVTPDLEKWRNLPQNSGLHILEAISSPAIRQFVEQLSTKQNDEVDMELARAALISKYLYEGKSLYAMNCRTCHGDGAAGNGPMADGFKLRPIDFTESGSIETLFEGYAFWRISTGGRGLPTEATPWNSSMPQWGQSLTDDEQWLILLASYHIAGKTPLVTEFE